MLMVFSKGKSTFVDSPNDVYELMIKQLEIHSILDLKIKWRKVLNWLGYFQWVSKSYEAISSYLEQKGLPYVY